MPTQWGCDYFSQRKKRKLKKKKIKKYKRFKKHRAKPHKRYYKRKVIENKKENKKRDRKPKSRCECWNCGETGHLSYDCDKKKVRILIEDYEDIKSELSEIEIDLLSTEESEIFEIYSDTSIDNE